MTSANYLIPNSYQTPNALVDLIMPLLTDQEWRVLSYAVRHILGFDDYRALRQRRLSVSVFHHGYGPFPGCGLGRTAIMHALDGLAAFGVMIRIGETTNDGQMWELPLDPKRIDLKGLKARFAARSRSAKKQTATARTAKHSKRSVQQTTKKSTSSGLSNRPPIKTLVVCQTDHKWSVEQTRGGLSDRRNQTDSQTHPQTHKRARYSRADVGTSGLLPVPAGFWQALRLQVVAPYFIRSLQATLDEAARAEAAAAEEKRANDAIKAIISGWIKATGNLDPNVWKNKTIRACAASLDAAGFTAADVVAFVKDRQKEDFWRARGISLKVVVNDISRWKAVRDDDDIDYYEGPAENDAPPVDSADYDGELIEMPDDIRARLAAMRSKVAVE